MHTDPIKTIRLSAWLAWLFCVWLLPCRAEPPAEPIENRFLFLVDISSAMSKSAPQGLRSALELLGSNMQGQLLPGDTIGLWTYNNKLHTDMPMLVWSDASKPRIMENIATHWRAQSYGKKSRLDIVLPFLLPIIQNSRALTIVWITDGKGALHGMPFDSQINQLHAEYAQELRQAGQCFVTILLCRENKLINFAVNSSVGPFCVPQAMPTLLKPSPVVATTPANPPVEQKPKEMKQFVIGPPTKTNAEAKATSPINPPVAIATTNSIIETNFLPTAATGLKPPPAPAAAVSLAPPTATIKTVAVPILTSASPAQAATVQQHPPSPPTNTVTSAESPTLISIPAGNSPATQEIAISTPTTPTAEVSNDKAANDAFLTTNSAPADVESKAPAPWRLLAACVLLALALIIGFTLLHFLRKDRVHSSLISESIKRTERGGRS